MGWRQAFRALLGIVVGVLGKPSEGGPDRLELAAVQYLAVGSVEDDVLHLNSNRTRAPAMRLWLTRRGGRLFARGG